MAAIVQHSRGKAAWNRPRLEDPSQEGEVFHSNEHLPYILLQFQHKEQNIAEALLQLTKFEFCLLYWGGKIFEFPEQKWAVLNEISDL